MAGKHKNETRPRVLIVDDDLVFRQVLAHKVTKLGYTVQQCTSGEEVVKLLESGGLPSLLLIDWMMPGLSGIDLVIQLRRAKIDPVYIVLVTSKGKTQDIVEALRAGADDFLPKNAIDTDLAMRLDEGTAALEQR